MGEKDPERAQGIFTISIIFITAITVVISILSFIFMEPLARIFGANKETLVYTMDYMRILFIFSLIIAWENCMSIFVRNDGDPQLAMIGLIVSALLNIVLDYWMIFMLDMEVTGAALATALATAAGLAVYLLHFFKKGSGLKFIKHKWRWREVKQISMTGLPSFLSEAGTGIFVMGYNIAIACYAGTEGLAAFSVINYLHTFMFLAFIGIGQSIQPMISYYYGAKSQEKIMHTVKVAEWTGLALGGDISCHWLPLFRFSCFHLRHYFSSAHRHDNQRHQIVFPWVSIHGNKFYLHDLLPVNWLCGAISRHYCFSRLYSVDCLLAAAATMAWHNRGLAIPAGGGRLGCPDIDCCGQI
ncbi:MATE family efflux transporter [Virgibacillus halophilus]|uniref:MATE family efflux transporter n=1 Tax=Tigheibacillus halophilus TaxID=361280 RepID=A0ABU5C742_9BACI|nr:MATE family efflux transporter [Virgibacillus halophilus]